jgi:hypothetical protein
MNPAFFDQRRRRRRPGHFVGRTPTLVVDRTFLQPEPGAPDLSFATIEPTPEITDRVLAALPSPDVKFDVPCPSIKYLHRSLKDGEGYFFFKESNETQSRTAALAAPGSFKTGTRRAGQFINQPTSRWLAAECSCR